MNSNASWNERQHLIINELMSHAPQSTDIEHSRRSLESLLKKLKEEPDILKNLYTAVTTLGVNSSGCVPIPRTLDGRLQVNGKKGFPHVMFAKIFRWPELQKGELRNKRCCLYPYDQKLESICVNPYHYDRVTSGFGDPNDSVVSSNSEYHVKRRVEDSGVYISPFCRPTESSFNMNSNFAYNPLTSNLSEPPSYSMHQNYPQSMPANPMASNSMIFNQMPTNQMVFNPHQMSANPMFPNQVVPLPIPSKPMSNRRRANHEKLFEKIKTFSPLVQGEKPIASNIFEMLHKNPFPQNHLYSIMYSQFYQLQRSFRKSWCNVMYFEYNTQYGNPYNAWANQTIFVIDGYANCADPRRYSIGRIQNDRRCTKSDTSRKFVGDGFEVTRNEYDNLMLFCRADRPMFVKGPLMEFGNGAIKIFPKTRIEIFNFKLLFERILGELNTCETADIPKIPSLQKEICEIDISFNKGWGGDYNRKSVTDSPSWVELTVGIGIELQQTILSYYRSNEGLLMHTNYRSSRNS